MTDNKNTNERIEQIKKMLISEQEGIATNEQIINDLVAGKIKLLSAKDIYTRLNISSDEFTQLVKRSDPNFRLNENNIVDTFMEKLNLPKAIDVYNVSSSNTKDSYSFPKPDLYIAGKARWSPDTLKKWLLQGSK